MNVITTDIPSVLIIEPKVFSDKRGFFIETFQSKRYKDICGIADNFVQDNHSRSGKNVLRGMHFQRNQPQGKLIYAIRGEVYSVAVDVRQKSPTFGKWVGVILSEENNRQFWIPPGLAHGFVVLSDLADVQYKCTNFYDVDDEVCLMWNDPHINIHWPKNIAPILSIKDNNGLSLNDLFR